MKAFALGLLCVVMVGCSSVPKEEPRVTMAVVHHDTRYTDGVTEVMAECAKAVMAVTAGQGVPDKVIDYVYTRCLIDNGATL